MERVSREEYLWWRNNGFTLQFMEYAVDRMDSFMKNILENAGVTPTHDFYRRGYIDGLRELIEWEPDFNQEDKDGVDGEGA